MGLLSHVGPITRTVADAALMLTVLAGPDDRDPYALPPTDTDYGDGLEDGIDPFRRSIGNGNRRQPARGGGQRHSVNAGGRHCELTRFPRDLI